MRSFSPDFDHNVMLARQLLRATRDIPANLVADEVQRSWLRSVGYGLNEHDRVLFNPVSSAKLRRIDEKYHSLLSHAVPEMERLFSALDKSLWVLACVEGGGSIVKTLGGQSPASRDIATVLRPGLNVSERVAGTSAPACVLEEKRAIVVRGREHFLEEAQMCACAAVPIFEPSGGLAGVLNASRHHRGPFTGVLEPLALAARSIENRMVAALPAKVLMRLHYSAELVNSPMCGLLAVTLDGQILGANPLARQLLEIDSLAEPERHIKTVFERAFGPLFDTLRKHGSSPIALKCYNGMRIHACLSEATRVTVGASSSCLGTVTRTGMPSMLADPDLVRRVGQAERAFARDIPVLINGETGTGKELLARHLHESGPRASGPFVAINCSAIPASLIESELFGYDEGAFTGARRGGMVGRLEQANGGTLFLDEIGDMPLELQARLLRVLQERTLTRLGGASSVVLNCSVICATHRDLVQRMSSGEFREDLYYRINGLRINLPALRHRKDLNGLIDHILEQMSPTTPLMLTSAARDCLHRHAWPGNIRELQQTLRLGAALAEEGCIDLIHLPVELASAPDERPSAPCNKQDTLSDGEATLRRAEAEVIRSAFLCNQRNVSATARILGISRATLYRKLRNYDLLK